MISENPEWDEFLRSHRWAVLTTLRTSGSPVSAIVAYALDGDDLVVSTPQTTFRHASIANDERVNLCAISNHEPFNFVAVEGRCDIERTGLVRTTKLVFKAIEGTGYEEPADLPGWLADQQRVILRIKPTRVYGVIR
ncbi:MAG: hypothetical protein F4171_16135 [Gammaproteobacteria bacterium]|nr:hypothetical protein [Gammaproteobacteria bacterium]